VRQQLLKEENSLSNLIAAMANEQAQGIEVVKLSQFEQRIILIENQVQDLRSLLQKKKEKVNQAHGHMVARSKERKIMETLQQKQNEAWQQYLMQKETATLDEIAVIFHNRE
jgi:flagellar FliJ protein